MRLDDSLINKVPTRFFFSSERRSNQRPAGVKKKVEERDASTNNSYSLNDVTESASSRRGEAL